MSKSKDLGTRAETAVVRYLQANGFPHAERRALRGEHDAGDVTGTPGVCWEVKGGNAAKTASDAQIRAWLTETETERENAHADFGILVTQRSGYGPDRAGQWWAHVSVFDLTYLVYPEITFPEDVAAYEAFARLRLADLVTLLRRAGYGEPLDDAG